MSSPLFKHKQHVRLIHFSFYQGHAYTEAEHLLTATNTLTG